MSRLLSASRRWVVAGLWVYFSILFGWVGLYGTTQDQIPYLALMNNLVVYIFFPLPLVLILAIWLRRKEIWAGMLLGGGLFAFFWGPLFLTPLHPDPSGLSLRVLTYNVLGRHTETEPVLEVIETVNPDVALLQEVNFVMAQAIESRLSFSYPYQELDPAEGVTGMGVISKFPLERHPEILPLEWVGAPQILILDWEAGPVTLVNFHMFPSGLGSPWGIAYVFRAREAQAQELADFAAREGVQRPVVAAGDANVTDLSTAYHLVAMSLDDAWRQAGFGLGHTFPGSDIPGSARPRIAGLPVPRWLARIDYVFVSGHWQAASAHLAPVDGVSDHRGVVADLVLVEP